MNGDPLDEKFGSDDIAPETATQLREEFDDFVAANSAIIARIRVKHPGCTPAQIGHDFWLTRNGHGWRGWTGSTAPGTPWVHARTPSPNDSDRIRGF